jgi:hypothetical protein
VTGAGWPASAAPAPSARSPAGAPAAAPVARSASTPTRRCSRKPASGSGIPPGGPTTARTARRSNASWRICSAAGMAGGAPAGAGCCGSGRTGGCWPPRSTSPAWGRARCALPTRWVGAGTGVAPTKEPIHNPSAHPQGPTTIADNLPRAIRSALLHPIGHQRPRRGAQSAPPAAAIRWALPPRACKARETCGDLLTPHLGNTLVRVNRRPR